MEHSGIPGVRGNEGGGWGLERKMCLQKRWRNVKNETTNRYWEYRELSPRNEHDLHQRQNKFKTRTDKEDLFPRKLKFTKHGILPNICTACLFCEILQFKITNLMKDCFVQITRECFFFHTSGRTVREETLNHVLTWLSYVRCPRKLKVPLLDFKHPRSYSMEPEVVHLLPRNSARSTGTRGSQGLLPEKAEGEPL